MVHQKHGIIYALECNRCQHKWIPRSANLPKACPACKNRLWNEKREKKGGK